MIAVISGDLIKSQHIPKQQYDSMLYQLDQSLRFVANRYDGQFSVFRGDALQLQLNQPRVIFRAAILVYLQLKSANYKVRQSLAIGHVDNLRADIKTATGAAFTLSGRGLDNMTQQHLILHIEGQTIADGFALTIELIDVLLDKITPKQANALFYYLTLADNNHATLAKELKTSRENVTKLLNLAHYQVIERFLNYSESAIATQLAGAPQ
ncbi:hypothetical protein [Pseudoalteromonas mariniglutinosa]|uniref:hypothetical protein n=1 Tax=Pseudoalteromonas mariniglutinosa TaxID=206042 RepID=UPI00384E93F9